MPATAAAAARLIVPRDPIQPIRLPRSRIDAWYRWSPYGGQAVEVPAPTYSGGSPRRMCRRLRRPSRVPIQTTLAGMKNARAA
jgi:hypothetical protein